MNYINILSDGFITVGAASNGQPFGDHQIPITSMITREDGLLYTYYEDVVQGDGMYHPLDDKEVEDARDRKVDEVWSFSNTNNNTYVDKMLPGRNKDKQKRLALENDAITEKLISEIVLTPEEESNRENYNEYLIFTEDTNTISDLKEDEINALTSTNDIRNYVIDDGSYPVVPFTGLNEDERETLIDELLSQAGMVLSDLTPTDEDLIVVDYISKGKLVSLSDTYGNMPSGRDLYDSLNEVVDQDIGVMITKHIHGNTYFNIDSQLFSTVK